MFWSFLIQLRLAKRQFGISVQNVWKIKSIVTILYPIIRDIELDRPIDQLSVYCARVVEARNLTTGMVFT